MLDNLIMVLDVIAFLFALGSFIYAKKTFILIKNKGLKLLIWAVGFAIILRFFIILEDFNFLAGWKEGIAAAISIFWIFLFTAIYELYKKSEEIMK